MWDCLCSPTGASFECMYIAILFQVASVLGCMPQCLHGPACQINGWQTDLLHERAGTTRRRGCCRRSRVGCSCAELGPADTATAAEADPTCSCCCGHAELATADAAAKGGCCDVDVDGGAGTDLRTSAWCFCATVKEAAVRSVFGGHIGGGVEPSGFIGGSRCRCP